MKVSFRCELINFFFASFAEFRTVLCTIVAIVNVFTSNTHIFQFKHMNTFHNNYTRKKTASITTCSALYFLFHFFFGKKHPHTMMNFALSLSLYIFLFAVFFSLFEIVRERESFSGYVNYQLNFATV